MKKNMSRMLSLLLAVILLLPAAVACGKGEKEESVATTTAAVVADGNDTEATSATEVEAEPAEPADDELLLDLTQRYDGEKLNMMIRQEYVTEFMAENVTGDIINDTSYNRDLKISEDLGITINYIPVAQGSKNETYNNTIRNDVLSASKEFDVTASYAYYTTALSTEGLFYNWQDVKNVDLTRVWWGSRSGMADQLTINGKLYLISGDASFLYTQKAFAVFFNKTLLENNNIVKSDDLYQLVHDGKWTLDKLIEYSSSLSADLDGNGTYDGSDQYGLVTYLKTSVDNFFPCFGVNIVTRDDQGNYNVAINNEHTVAVTDKLNQLFYSDNRTYLVGSKGDSVKAFTGNHAAFTLGGLEWYPSFKDMESDYGVLPYPKFDENQKNYSTSVSDPYSLFGILNTCDKIDMVGAAMELYGYYNYTELTPAYYEIVLKGKSARDSESFAMLDIVHDSISFDLGFFYSGALGNPAQMFRTLLKDSTSANFASYWESKGPALEANVKALIEAFNK